LLPIALTLVLTYTPRDAAQWALVSIFLLLPATLWLGTIWETPSVRLLGKLGDISYPLYCIHGVLIQASGAMGGAPRYTWIVLISAAWWLESRVDRPLRQWLLAQAKARGLISTRPAKLGQPGPRAGQITVSVPS
jgi:peptidoglycan/LPS O-acetylase OafA/YrhL